MAGLKERANAQAREYVIKTRAGITRFERSLHRAPKSPVLRLSIGPSSTTTADISSNQENKPKPSPKK